MTPWLPRFDVLSLTSSGFAADGYADFEGWALRIRWLSLMIELQISRRVR